MQCRWASDEAEVGGLADGQGRQAGRAGGQWAIGNGRVATPLHGPPLRRSGRVEAAMLDVPRQQAGTFLGIGVVEAL